MVAFYKAASLALIGPEGREQLKIAARVSAVGLEIAISVALGAYAGRWADQRWHTDPYLMLVGVGLGLAVGFRSLYRIAKRMNESPDKTDQ